MIRKHHFTGKAAALFLAAAMTLALPAWSIQAAETEPGPVTQTEESSAPESSAGSVQETRKAPGSSRKPARQKCRTVPIPLQRKITVPIK